MTMPKKKVQISVYLEPEVMKTLSAYAARRGQSMSLIVEAAVASFLSPDGEERREAATSKRLDRQDRRLARLERDIGITVETLALFIRFWLTTTPPLPEPAARAARAQAGARYDNFVAALGRRLAQGPRLQQEIPDDVSDPAPQDEPDS
ncbi:ribbon-helix-helix protein, CopG family [Acetobacter fabarum]|uniref:ribbon-helix-helix protein, CopG family n=2 Tax=Acetobacter fabarum TaxID=483199 RepID=UPI0014045866|nr:ribbon-helix-helix protein, CopG family [Acetobacter fabarum]NHO43113.1 ribbon-helix-helix protein, CopG family [Acetobacter fabarum]